MNLKVLSIGLLVVSGILSGYVCGARANVLLMDERLVLSGFVKETAYIRTGMNDREQRYHDSNLDYLQTSFLFETLYTVKDDADFTIRLFGGVKGWWQKATHFDRDFKRSIPARDRKHWTRPRSFNDDVITEAYVDFIKGPLQVRVGKQIVIWGQLDMSRVADVVNPLDIRRGFPGENPWEDIKQGLWMVRAFYESDLPGNLLFETIFNPGDYKNMQIVLEGTHKGVKPYGVRFFDPVNQQFGIYHWQRQKWSHDAPGWHLKKNWELGFRVRGHTWGVDWTLLYWNARDDTAVAHPGRIGAYTLPFIKSGIMTAMNSGWVPPANVPDDRVYYYKRYQTIGGTTQVNVHPLWDTVWRTEWFYEINRPLNKATFGDSQDIYGWTRRDIFGAAAQCSKTFEIPWFTRTVGADRRLEVSLTYFWEKVLNHDHDLVLSDRDHAWTNSTTDTLIMFMKQDMFHSKLIFIFTGRYFLRTGKWMAIPSLCYVFPGIHWRFDMGYVAEGGPKRNYVKSSATMDKVTIRLRYEF
ncbi:MAG: hypothetical protein GY868_11125 [Deltaproteobacteria bacterium]|nr:hypothetical protein [Deltaproteobacteria bacterium]